MFCPKCGKQLKDDDVFCYNCGSTIAKKPAPPRQSAPQTYQQPVQQPYQQTAYQQPYQQPIPPAPQAAPPQKKGIHPAAVFLITMLIGGAAIAAVALFYRPGYLVNRDDDDGGKKKSKSDSSVSVVDESAAVTVTEPETAPPETTAETATQTEETTTTTTTVTTAETETTTTTTAATKSEEEIKAEENAAALAEAFEYSTYERPAFDQFEWCYGQNGMIKDVPEGAEELSNPFSWSGGWKCMVIYENSNDTFVREIDNADINVYEDGSADLTMDWYYIEVNNEPLSEETMEDTIFSGGVKKGKLVVTGSGKITMKHLWKENGAEYAVGDFMLPDGTTVYIAMTRRPGTYRSPN